MKFIWLSSDYDRIEASTLFQVNPEDNSKPKINLTEDTIDKDDTKVDNELEEALGRKVAEIEYMTQLLNEKDDMIENLQAECVTGFYCNQKVNPKPIYRISVSIVNHKSWDYWSNKKHMWLLILVLATFLPSTPLFNPIFYSWSKSEQKPGCKYIDRLGFNP